MSLCMSFQVCDLVACVCLCVCVCVVDVCVYGCMVVYVCEIYVNVCVCLYLCLISCINVYMRVLLTFNMNIFA